MAVRFPASLSNAEPRYLSHGDFVYRGGSSITVVGSEGACLHLKDGTIMLDGEGANGAAALGYDATILMEAAARAAASSPAVPSFCETPVRQRVAENIVREFYQDTGVSGRVAFELGGAQGIELAIKVIRSNTSKSQIVVFEGGYHGRSGLTSQLSASHRYRRIHGDWRLPVVRVPHPDCEQCRFSQVRETCHLECVRFVEQMFKREYAGVAFTSPNGIDDGDIAALIIEPLVNVGGMALPDPEYMNSLVRLCRERGALIVLDEVFTGSFRTGKRWGFQHYDFIPDMIVASKTLTNGITPLSYVWAREPLMDAEHFPPGTHSATFLNNPLALYIAEVVQERWAGWQTRAEDIDALEVSLQHTVDEIVRRSPLARSGYVLGGVGRILLEENVARQIQEIARTPRPGGAIMGGVNSLLVARTGMAPNVIAFHPPLNMAPDMREAFHLLLIEAFDRAGSQL